jgi:septation ring formation regulator EzrA
MDLEGAAEVAIVKIKELSAHVDKAEAAFTALEEKLDDVKAQFETDWASVDEKARVLLELARARTTDIADEGEEARQGLTQLDEALEKNAPQWDEAIANSGSETSTLGGHVSEQGPVVSAAGDEARAATRSLAERATAIETQLQQALADVRELLESEVANELRETQEAIRDRAAALQATLVDECGAMLGEAFAGWEQQLAQVEDVIEEEFASARKHAADVVEFSLQECERGHEEAWAEMKAQVATLEGLLLRLGEAVAARTAEVGERRNTGEQALTEAAAGVERMRAALAQQLETLARYEFVNR